MKTLPAEKLHFNFPIVFVDDMKTISTDCSDRFDNDYIGECTVSLFERGPVGKIFLLLGCNMVLIIWKLVS